MGQLNWDVPPPDFDISESVSVLYAIEPFHSHSARRESLSSLIIRIAHEHSVSPRDMIQYVIGAQYDEIRQICKGTFFRSYAAPINGLGRYAELFIRALEDLAALSGLSFHTLLPLKGVLACQGSALIYQGTRWCATCYQEMHEIGITPYRLLLWSLAATEHCHLHGERLRDICPHCASSQPIIPRWPDIAFCDSCRGPLFGMDIEQKTKCPAGVRLGQHAWYELACVDILTNLHKVNQYQAPIHFRRTVQAAIDTTCDGNRAEFCRKIGISVHALGKILRGEDKPAFMSLLRLSYALDFLPSRFLISEYLPNPTSIKIVRSVDVAQRPETSKDSHIEDALGYLYDSTIPPPAAQVAAKLKLSRSGLKSRYPEFYLALIEKRRSGLRDLVKEKAQEREEFLTTFVKTAIENRIFPGKDMVESALRQRGWSLLRPELRLLYHTLLVEMMHCR